MPSRKNRPHHGVLKRGSSLAFLETPRFSPSTPGLLPHALFPHTASGRRPLPATGRRRSPRTAAPACSRPAAPTRKPRLPHQQVDEIVVSCKVKSILSSQHRCLLRLFYLLSPSSSCAARLRLLLSFLSLRFRELLVEMTNLSSWMPLMGSSTCRSMGFWCKTAFLPARSSASTFGVVASAVARCQMRGGLRLSSTVVKGANPATQLHIKMSQGSC